MATTARNGKRGSQRVSVGSEATPHQVEEIAEFGWTILPGLIEQTEAKTLTDSCLQYLSNLGRDVRVGDKPWAGTRRLVNLNERIPEVGAVVNHVDVSAVVDAVLGPGAAITELTMRCPTPGFGRQKLHADDLPLASLSGPTGLTAIVPLVDFTETNGSTRIIPVSHRRLDLQRLSGRLEDHPDAFNVKAKAGDMILFSRHLLHSGTTNQSKKPRPAFQICWWL